jgi:hypothetical protein
VDLGQDFELLLAIRNFPYLRGSFFGSTLKWLGYNEKIA